MHRVNFLLKLTQYLIRCWALNVQCSMFIFFSLFLRNKQLSVYGASLPNRHLALDTIDVKDAASRFADENVLFYPVDVDAAGAVGYGDAAADVVDFDTAAGVTVSDGSGSIDIDGVQGKVTIRE